METSVATFHSLRGEKSALILVKANPLQYNADPVYVPISGVEYFAKKKIGDMVQGDIFDIPAGYKLTPMVDPETGEVRKSNDGNELKVLSY